MRQFTRREVCSGVGLIASPCLLSSCLSEKIISSPDKGKESDILWAYAPLDPDTTAERAYKYYYEGHCMYGVFKSIVSQLAELKGQPYDSFPFYMMRYGAGGVAGWGSLCGGLNGGAAVTGLFTKTEEQRRLLIDELFRWYEKTELPLYVPKKAKLKMEMARSISNSILCHTSVSKWCKASGYRAFSNQHLERCACLTADMAKMTVEILNSNFQRQFIAAHSLSEEAKTCNFCHAKGGEREDSVTKMNCSACHLALGSGHGK